jgi:hypothetical protein
MAAASVTVTPGVGTITISWVPTESKETYAVTSSPAGLSCKGKTSCTMVDTSTEPYSFTVTATTTQGDSIDSPPTAPLDPHEVVIVAGQSNATGQQSLAVDPVTGINYMAAPYANGADANDLITWEPWEILPGAGATPVALDSPQQVMEGAQATTIFGPEIGIARQMWTEGRPVTVIKAAYEGTNLAENWAPKGTGALPDGLFPAMVAKVQSVMAADAAAGQFDVIASFNWYQGESDAGSPRDATLYQQRLAALIAAVRKDLPMPTAPVVLAKEDSSGYDAYQVGTGAVTPAEEAKLLTGNTEVRAADDWAAANLPDVVEVDTAGLARVGPLDLHLRNVSELTLGGEMATVSEPLSP